MYTPKYMISRQSGDHRPNDGRYPASFCRRLSDKMSSTDRLTIVGRLTPDDRATLGRYHIEKKSSKSRPVNGRQLPDASPMTKPLKIGGTETLNLGASTKKSSADPKICQNRCRQSADVARFFHFRLTDRRATFGFGNMTVWLGKICTML